MKLFSRKALIAIFAALLLLLLAACGSGDSDSDSNETSGDSEDPITLSFLIDNQTVTDGLEAVAEDIEEKFNIQTEFELRPGGTEGDNIVKTRLATDEMTDIMWYNSGSLFQALNPEEHFLDLSGEAFMDRVTDDFKEAVTVGEGVYGVPGESTFAGGWMYNVKVYEELGLEVPTTWDELLANNDKIKEAGKVPVIASFKDTWTSQVILLGDYYNVHSVDPEFADKFTNNEAKFASTPIALAGFEKLQDLQDHGHYNDEETATSYEDAIEMLATGEAAHYPMLTTTLQAINDRFPDQVNDIGFFGQPSDDPDNHGATIWIPATLAVNANSENADAAKQWLEYFVSEEGQETYMANMKAYGPYALHDVELPDDAYTAVKDMMEYQDAGKTAPALEFLSPLKGPNLEQITVEVGLGMVPPEEGADKYDRDVERQAKQLQIEGW
ncbi:raffinose/stachyose/melibiose transport system substrate-binding protein [Gracilibacillus halotolerans]|uniref:Raffinose/stachyose/melibiose transport system substrate-binding protein n=1 Tax=Gracilibacillus halotolerans TaxID=74386 RepID=A0A841RLK7_9BACI|nr:ABC transporter substrate-binding protein [Gracilibacillus halotolerans]MBB6512822.1 raffinose/stachyose/melibiose transport system substrate-binding protein [Gracilibacillus halotolerans]